MHNLFYTCVATHATCNESHIYTNCIACIHFPTASSSTTINFNVKLRLYPAIVIPASIYACETWKRTAMITHRLDVFHRRCLRAILDITWREHVTNEEFTRRAGMERLQDIVTRRRKWLATFSDCREKDLPIQLCTGCVVWVVVCGSGTAGLCDASSVIAK